MKYHGFEIRKVVDSEVDGGKYYEVYRDGKLIATAWTFRNAKEFIDSGCNDIYLC